MGLPISGNGGDVVFDGSDEENVRIWNFTDVINLLEHTTSDSPNTGRKQREPGNLDWSGSISVYTSNATIPTVAKGQKIAVMELFTSKVSGKGGKFSSACIIGDITQDTDIEGDNLTSATIAIFGNGEDLVFTANP